MAVDRNVQYGNIAVRNNWITREQFEEALSLHTKLSSRGGNKGLKIEELLLEKGLISDVQHQAVISVLERMIDEARKKTTGSSNRQKRKTTGKKPQRDRNLISCPHCGATNRRGEEECGSCQGYIPPSGDDGGVELLEKVTCPSCQRGIKEDALECVCGAMFCPECRGLRAITDPTCRHCGVTFPGMERVARARAAALASGAIKVKKDTGPVATQMPRWVVPMLVVVIGTLFFFALPSSGPEIDIQAYNDARETLNEQKGAAYAAFIKKDWSEATKLYKRARASARQLKDHATGDADREREATQELEDISSKLKTIDRRRSEPSSSTGGSGGDGSDEPTTGGDSTGSGSEGSGSGDGSGSTGEGSGSAGPVYRDDAVLPEDMSPEKRLAALEELKKIKIALPAPAKVDAAKLIIVFHRDGREYFGELLKKTPSRYTILTHEGKRAVSTSEVRGKPVTGKPYYRGPVVKEMKRTNGYPLKGRPERVTRSGKLLYQIEGGSSQIVRPSTVKPRDYYRAMRYALNPSKPEHHLFLAKICISLELRSAARREFFELARAGGEHALIAMPYIAPTDFLRWWVKRDSTVDQLKALALWAGKTLEPREQIKVYERVVRHPDLKDHTELQMGHVAALIAAGQFDKAQEKLVELSKSKNGDLKFKASTALRDLEKTRKQQEKRLKLQKKIRVTTTMLELLGAELRDIVAEKEFKVAERRARIGSTYEKLLKQAADKLGISLDDARDGWIRRRELAPRRPAAVLSYGDTTWLVDTPAAMYFGLGTTQVEAMRQAHWDAMSETPRLNLLRGMFLESWFKIIVKRKPIDGEEKERDVNDFRGASELFKRLPVKARAGYYRNIEAR